MHSSRLVRGLRLGSPLPLLLGLAVGCSDSGPAGPQVGDAPTDAVSAVAVWLRGPGALPFSDPRKPDVTLVVTSQGGERCDVSVAARATDGSDHRVARAEPVAVGVCAARIVDLEAGTRYVYSARNAIIDDAADYQVWPNFRAVPWEDLPEREGAVFVHAATGAYTAGIVDRLVQPNLYLAYERARPLPGSRNADANHLIELPLQYGTARTVTVTVPEAQSRVFVYAMGQLDPAQLPQQAEPSPFPPGIGWYAARTASAATMMLARERIVVLEGRDEEGITYSGMLPPFETSIELRRDPGFFFTYYIVDPFGDAFGGADIGLVRYGTEAGPGGVQTDAFLIKIDARGVRDSSIPQFGVVLTDLRDSGGTIVLPQLRVGIRCTRAPIPTCTLAGVDPPNAAARVLGVASDLNADGDGWVELRLDFTGIDSALLRTRAGIGNSTTDWAPDVGLTLGPNIANGYAEWRRTAKPGTSWNVPW